MSAASDTVHVQVPAHPGMQTDHPDLVEQGSPGPMAGLAEETVSHVLSFLPLDSVTRSMRVDRKWERAARCEVRACKVLSLRPLADCDACRQRGRACPECRQKRFSDESIGIDEIDNCSVLTSLIQMTRLTELDLHGLQLDGIGMLLMQNAKTLVRVRGVQFLPAPRSHLYPKLEQLEVDHFDDETAAACPSLSQLGITDFDQRLSLSLLPVDSMRSLQIRVSSYAQLEYLFQAKDSLSRLTGVDDFTLDAGALIPSKQQFDRAILMLLAILGNFNLRTLCLHAASAKLIKFPLMALAMGAPDLESVTLVCDGITNNMLLPIASLKNLQSVYLQPGSSLTTKGVLNFLFSCSVFTSSLTRLTIKDAPKLDKHRIGEQFKLMLAARGLTPDPQKWGNADASVLSFEL